MVDSIRRVLVDDGIQEVMAKGEPVKVADIEIERVQEFGVIHVAKALWDRLGIGAAIRKHGPSGKAKLPFEPALLAMALQRWERPGSKLAC